VPAKRLTRQSIPDQTVQPLEPLAHVGREFLGLPAATTNLGTA
jgi:hypothetical protein